MKTFFKVIMAIVCIGAALKLTESLIDYFYEQRGKRYITTIEE